METRHIRYNVEHVGDIVADILEKPVEMAQRFAGGVALTYDISELNRRKKGILAEMGERMVMLAAQDSRGAVGDEILEALAAEAAEVEKAINALVRDREERLKGTSCCTGPPAEPCTEK